MQIVELKVNVEKSQLEALAAEVEKLNGKVINFKTSTGGTGGASPTAGINKGLKETSQQAEKTGQSIMSVVGKVAKWTAVTTAVYAPVKAFKEALGTLKEVDSQLVQVQKVTNFSQRQMKEIEQQAYKTASAYGVSADKYTESVAAFARAGYKEQSAGLAELSTKTQLVGDTTAEVANQFLLSTDAAYKYHGSVQQLSRVLDGANELDNNYATSIEKIAEGMGLVAPVAAQAGIGVDELMASLGTITAVTQRSGAEAARAYRALVLNILGDTKTEIADGATWTAGEIEGLRDVLKTYAPEAVKAAEATGDIINPMKAMEGLSQAMKDGVLTEQKLMEMVSDIGGKLRTSQLLALIQNWDMYESMLSDFQNAAGSADKEVENAMNSWERKTEVLKNTWTEFVSHMVDTDLIKGGLDGITKGIEFLDSDLGQSTIKMVAFTAGIVGIGKAISGVRAALGAAGIGGIKDIIAGIQLLPAAIGPLGIAIAGIAAVLAAPAIVDFFTTDYKEQAQSIGELTDKYEELYGVQSEYETLHQKDASGEGLSNYERNRLKYLEEEKKNLEDLIQLEKERAQQKYQQEYGSMAQDSTDEDYYRNGGRGKNGSETVDVKMLREASDAFDDLNKKAQEGKVSEQEYREELSNIISAYDDFYNTTKDGIDAGIIDPDSLTEAQKELMNLYETMQKFLNIPVEDVQIVATLDKLEESGMGVTDFANQTVVDADQIRQAFSDAGMGIEETNAAIEALRAGGAVVIDVENDGGEETLQNLEKLGIATQEADGWHVDINGLEDLAGKLGFSKTEADKLVDALGKINGVDINFDGAADSLGIVYDSVQSLIASNPTIDIDANDNASGTIQTVEGEKESVSQPTNTELNATDNASGTIGNVSAQARMYGDMRPNSVLTATDNASSVIRGAVSALAGFVSKSITLTAKYVTSGKGPGGGGWGSGSAGLGPKATGDLHFKGGPVLLGDELSPDGSPRPELVITKNGAFVAGMNGPVMTSLPAGARIFKYSDTMDIMSGGDLTQLQAFGGGGGGGSLSDIYLRGKDKQKQPAPAPAPAPAPKPKLNPSGGGGGGSSGGSSGSRSSGSSRSSGRSGGRSSGSSGSSGGGGSSVDTLKEELELLEAQYSFLEASNASTEELWAKSDEIKAKLHQINDTLRSTGGKEKDIVDNSTKWWQETEKQRQLLEDDVSLLEAQYEFMEESGASAEDLNAKSEEIQAKLHEINELARATGGNEKDILATSQKWWAELKKIREVQRGIYQNERELLQSEADLMEHQNKSAGERIAKLRQIQDSLHQEAEYMRSIKASQAEINQLSIQWWEIEESILAIQRDLVDQLNAAMTAAIDNAESKVEDSTRVHRDNIKRFEKEREDALENLRKVKYADLELDRDDLEVQRAKDDLAQKELDKAEKLKKVEEARIALENAQKERNIRYYNASTGQWEWGADARNVKQAQEAYDKAKEDVEKAEDDIEEARKNLAKEERTLEYERERKATEDYYDGLIQAEEDAIDAMSDTLDSLRDRWDDMYQRMFGSSTENIEKILQQMLEQGLITEEQAAEIRAFWDKINGFAASIDDTTKKILAVVKTFAEARAENPNLTFAQYLEELEEEGVVIDTSRFSPSLVDYITNNPNSGWQAIGENGVGIDSEGNIFVAPSDVHARRSGMYYSEDESGNGVYVSSGDVARSHFHTGDDGTLEQMKERARQRNQEQAEKARSSSSASSTSSSSSSSSSKSDVVSQMQSNSAAWHNASDSEKKRLADENKKLGESQGWSRGDDGVWYDSSGKRVYDSGGILNGFGGIKATARDEIVIPPDLAEFMLKPSANKTFQSRVSELAYLYGAKPIPGTLSNNRSSNDHYGDTYTFGNVTLTEDKARNTTVYELAQMSRSLGIYRNG